MVTRIVSGLVGLIIFCIVMFTEKTVLSVGICLISLIGLWEIYHAFSYHKHRGVVPLGILSSVIFAFGDFLGGKLTFAFIFVVFLAGVVLMLTHHEKGDFTTKDAATLMFFTLAIPLIFSMLRYIRNMENGNILAWLPFIVSWLTDTFAYFTGRFFGKNKLCEKISPKKTVEGAIGGMAGAVIGCVVFGLIDKSLPIYFLIPFGMSGSVLSQMGDLFASCIKREYGIKDFGNIMPGHGGVLDRFDSLLLTIPYTYIFLMLFI